jgi:hypothetical protein
MSPEEIRQRTQGVWDRFYSLPSIWKRSRCVKSLRSRLAFLLISKLYRQMFATTGIATDSARGSRAATWARWLAKPCRRLFRGSPMPELQVPIDTSTRSRISQTNAPSSEPSHPPFQKRDFRVLG